MNTTSPRKKKKLVHPAAAPSAPAPRDGAGLTAAQRKLLAEALRRAEDARDVMEDALVSFGRWVLVNVFDDDAAAALDHRSANPVWTDLLARAGGPTLHLSRRLVHVALHIAARDKRITDEAWRALEPGRKELLLPLGDEAAMRKAAQHVQAMKLTQRATLAYVGALRSEQDRGRAVRLTGGRFTARVKRMSDGVTSAAFVRRAKQVTGELSDAQRAAVRRDVTALRAWTAEMLRALRRGG